MNFMKKIFKLLFLTRLLSSCSLPFLNKAEDKTEKEESVNIEIEEEILENAEIKINTHTKDYDSSVNKTP